MRIIKPGALLVCLGLLYVGHAANVGPAQKMTPQGIKQVQVSMASLKLSTTFRLGGGPDWMVVTKDSVWVSNDPLKAVQRINPATNRNAATIYFPAAPCSGLAFGFGSLWVPLCGQPATIARVDPRTNMVTATLQVGPADSEGGITSGGDSVWIVTDNNGTLVRIDPATNSVRQKISVAPGSYNPLFCDGIVWVTGSQSNVLTAVDAATGEVTAVVPVGPKPRFLTAGSGSVWTLNQGDGTVSRVDMKTKRVTAAIEAGIPGHGGEICYGADRVWATVMGIPLTQIDVNLNKTVRQWAGPGGDSVRFGHDSIWLTDLRHGLLWRIPFPSGLSGTPR